VKVRRIPPRDRSKPVLARPDHGCSLEEAMALTMDRYGQPGGALEQLAEIEREERSTLPASDEPQ
jgi:hypothetical protein